jgi:hypothetical protein
VHLTGVDGEVDALEDLLLALVGVDDDVLMLVVVGGDALSAPVAERSTRTVSPSMVVG